MAVEYSIRDGILTMDLSGTYESRDIVRAFLEAMNDAACPSPVALLIDVSRSGSFATRRSDEFRMVAEFIGPYADRIGGRCAVIAPSDVLFGLSQMACAQPRGRDRRARLSRDGRGTTLVDRRVHTPHLSVSDSLPKGGFQR